jgi:circadian clock protein KaiC
MDMLDAVHDKPGAGRFGANSLPKARIGIQGLDELTGGGLPRGRPTLVCGAAGCGKTLFAMEFLVRGAIQFEEPGVFMAFEETPAELTQNVRSLGFDLDRLVAENKISMDFVRVERSEIEETGAYDLEGLFIRLGHAIDSIGARRLVLDTIESLFSGLTNTAILRAELRRLFRWLKEKSVTAVITGELGTGQLTHHGLEEYVSDCVIVLSHRVSANIATRRLRIVKYRGSIHGTDEFPFLIDEAGISVLPVTSLGLQHEVSNERVSTGIARLDNMLGGQGYYRGSSILVSGTSGSGKTSIAAHFVDAACRRGERALYFAFEESEAQLVRNMRSIGIDLAPSLKRGLLHLHAARPTLFGLEMHLTTIHKAVTMVRPSAVVVDPISNFMIGESSAEAMATMIRLVDFFKSEKITAVFVNMVSDGTSTDRTQVAISSLIDTWLLLRDSETGDTRNRALSIVKSRGMAHSSQSREFLLTDHGVVLRDVHKGSDGVLAVSSQRTGEFRESKAWAADQEVDDERIANT